MQICTDEQKFWFDGLRILQNMQDMKQSGKCRLPADPLESETTIKDLVHGDNALNLNHFDSDDEDEFNNAKDISEYTPGEGYEYGFDLENEVDIERDLDILQKKERIQKRSVIESRADESRSIFIDDTLEVNNDAVESEIVEGNTEINRDESEFHCYATTKFNTLIGFASGCVVGNFSSEDMNASSESEIRYSNRDQSQFISEDEWLSLGFKADFDKGRIPTLAGIAEKVAREKNIVLDDLQYSAYEIICSTFLLSLVNEGLNNTNANTAADFGVSDRAGMEDNASGISGITAKVRHNLKKLGAKEQLLMFVTGPAGAGKSTAITVAQKYCFEFCKAIDYNWTRDTFLFTAMTGVAASIFGGMTIHSVAHMNKKDENITQLDMERWSNVKVLIIDEISMGTVSDMKRLNYLLNKFRKNNATPYEPIPPNMVFGGYSIIFSGDFRQIPPVKKDDDELIYRNPGLWENSINCAIMLENSHRFKDDPEFGEILKRMWKGDFTKEDIDRVNSRLIGKDLAIPSVGKTSDIAYACFTNDERAALNSATFQRHISDFPPIESDEMPPEHTIVVEADIRQSPKQKPKHSDRNNDSSFQSTFRVQVDPIMKSLIYSRLADSQVKHGNKYVDPALKLYVGAYCMITDNDDIKSGLANGTVCRVVGVKKKRGGSGLKVRNYSGKKVYAICVSDLDYVEFEHFPKSKEQTQISIKIDQLEKQISDDSENEPDELIDLRKKLKIADAKRRFRLSPKTFYCTFYQEDLQKNSIHLLPKKLRTRTRVTLEQLPINLCDATTGHKLQGCSKDEIVIHSVAYNIPGHAYTCVSRVRKLKGLFLNNKIDYFKLKKCSDKTSPFLKAFDERMKRKTPSFKVENSIS